MIEKKTTLILGAGASMHLGYPSGLELVKHIIDMTLMAGSKGRHFRGNLSNLGVKDSFIKDFGTSLRRSGRNSIDEFLQYRNEYKEIGKLAIAASLLRYENIDSLFVDSEEGNWYRYLYSLLNSSFEEFDKNQISIITFNYDRSLEFFLFLALINSYGKSEPEVASKLNNIKIIHIHGQLGELPWVNSAQGIPYSVNSSYDTDELVKRAKNIKIIHDKDVDSDPQLKEAHEEIKSSEKVLFLGFGYDPINMTRLGFNKTSSIANLESTVIGGTMFGLTATERTNTLKSYYKFKQGSSDTFTNDQKVLTYLREKDFIR